MKDEYIVRYYCSKPTVWDGDAFRDSLTSISFCPSSNVLSPLGGMVTFCYRIVL